MKMHIIITTSKRICHFCRKMAEGGTPMVKWEGRSSKMSRTFQYAHVDCMKKFASTPPSEIKPEVEQ